MEATPSGIGMDLKNTKHTTLRAQMHGSATTWYANGSKKDRIDLYSDGVTNGPASKWYENGQKEFRVFSPRWQVRPKLYELVPEWGKKIIWPI